VDERSNLVLPALFTVDFLSLLILLFGLFGFFLIPGMIVLIGQHQSFSLGISSF
jgi:hypothetical protein